MSWMSKNYHVAALGGGALLFAGLAYLGFNGASKADALLNLDGARAKKDTSVPGLEVAEGILKSVNEVVPYVRKKTAGGRPVDLSTSVDLFVPVSDQNSAIDLLEEPPVHGSIPNEWWTKFGVDPGFSDSPERDHDNDGYSNGEEYDDGTDPTDEKSYPALVHKLEVVKIDTRKWLGLLNSTLGNDRFQFRYADIDATGKKSEIRMKADDNVKVGDVFFSKEPAARRFKLIEMTTREVKSRIGVKVERVAIVEDLKENKKGERYRFLFRPRGPDVLESQNFDDVVHFRLNAVGQVDKIYQVPTNTEFKLKVDDKTRVYKLLKVKRGEDRKPMEVIVEYATEDGQKSTRTISLN